MPTPWNLPFHVSLGGIQTSNLMSESLVGRAVASTRQNAGSVVIAVCEPGGVKAPAATGRAALIVTLGIVRVARLAQSVPGAAASAAVSIGTDATAKATTK